MPLFVDDQGKVLAPTARNIWDALIDGRFEHREAGLADDGAQLDRHRTVAAERGEQVFHELATRHQHRIERERKKGHDAFRVRRKALHHVGLDAVRQYRERQLDHEEAAWKDRLRRREETLPELAPICLIRVANLAEGASS